MNLLNLPLPVKDRIFLYMEIHEIFLLSTCSKKTKESIKSSTLQSRYNGIKYISETYIKGSIAVCSQDEQFKTVIEWENQKKKSKISVRIDDLIIKCRIKYHSKTGIPVLYIEEYQKTTPVILYNYVTDLFKTETVLEFRIRRSDFSDFPPGITSVRNVVMDTHCQYATPKVFQDFFDKMKVDNCFLSEQCIRGVVNEKIQLMNIPNIYLEQATWALPHHLFRFTGKNAFLENTKFKNCDLNQFLRIWINGKLPNLESLIISTENVYRYNDILDGINRRQYDQHSRAQKFVYRAAFRDFFQKEFDFLDCSDCSDIERITDKTTASIKILSETRSAITRHYFFMFVWNSKFPEPGLYQNNEPGFRFL